MGHRELKRVPLDFTWPMNKVWSGFLCPYHSTNCEKCGGAGYNPATKQISDDWYDSANYRVTWHYNFGTNWKGEAAERGPWQIIGTTSQWQYDLTQDEVDALLAKGRLRDFTHTWTQGEGSKAIEPRPVITAEMVNEWARGSMMGHDSLNQYICTKARAKRLGVWGLCEVCEGHGYYHADPETKMLAAAWKPFEPSEGEGFQLWETVSEGSPLSPVFDSPEALATWCADNATIFASEKLSYRQWLHMFVGEEDLETGSMMVMTGGYIGSVANLKELSGEQTT